MIIDPTLPLTEWWGQGDTKWCVESRKIRKVTENKHVLTSERAGPILSDYTRASEACFGFRCFCVHCKLWADMWNSFCGWTFLFVICFRSLAHISLKHTEREMNNLTRRRKRNQSSTSWHCHYLADKPAVTYLTFFSKTFRNHHKTVYSFPGYVFSNWSHFSPDCSGWTPRSTSSCRPAETCSILVAHASSLPVCSL